MAVSTRLFLRTLRRPLKYVWICNTVCLFPYCKNMCFLCSMLSKSLTSEMPPAESGELLNRKLSSCLSWSTPTLSPTRSRGRVGTVCCTSSWASVKEVICTESSKSRKGGFCLRARWWSGLFRLPWLCRYCWDSGHSTCSKVTEGWLAHFREMIPQIYSWKRKIKHLKTPFMTYT